MCAVYANRPEATHLLWGPPERAPVFFRTVFPPAGNIGRTICQVSRRATPVAEKRGHDRGVPVPRAHWPADLGGRLHSRVADLEASDAEWSSQLASLKERLSQMAKGDVSTPRVVGPAAPTSAAASAAANPPAIRATLAAPVTVAAAAVPILPAAPAAATGPAPSVPLAGPRPRAGRCSENGSSPDAISILRIGNPAARMRSPAPCRLGRAHRREAVLVGGRGRARGRRRLLPRLLDSAGLAAAAGPDGHRPRRRRRPAGRMRAEGRAAIPGDGQRAGRRGDRHPVLDLLRVVPALGS